MCDAWELVETDYLRAGIANAMIEGMTVRDLWECAQYAETMDDFDAAVNMLAQTVPTAEALQDDELLLYIDSKHRIRHGNDIFNILRRRASSWWSSWFGH